MSQSKNSRPRRWLAAGAMLLVSPFAWAQTVSTVAGNGTQGYSGDGGPAIEASTTTPYDVVADAAGNFYFAELYGYRIRKVAADGTISTLAGTGQPGFSGDGGPATEASISEVYQLDVDAAGNVFFADSRNNRIRRVGTDGIITTVAGNGDAGADGEGGPAVDANVSAPVGVAVDGQGNLFLSELGSRSTEWQRVRKVAADGTISTIAGVCCFGGFNGDGGAATAAQLNQPLGLDVDSSGNVYVADYNNARIRKISIGGTISTVAGTAFPGDYRIDEIEATTATLAQPQDVAVDATGNLFIADSTRIRKVGKDGTIHAYAGVPSLEYGYAGDGGPAVDAIFNFTAGVAVDQAGQVYIADVGNQRVRRVSAPPPFTSCAAEGLERSHLALCQAVCEQRHTTAELNGLIVAYLRVVGTEPPCAR